MHSVQHRDTLILRARLAVVGCDFYRRILREVKVDDLLLFSFFLSLSPRSDHILQRLLFDTIEVAYRGRVPGCTTAAVHGFTRGRNVR